MKISVANGLFSKAAGVGHVHLSNMTLKYVLHVRNICCNLILFSKLTKELNCVVTCSLLIVKFRT